MYLKELTLRGFKSFATSTTLRFEPGITAVIGPNGSGKSNIVDALSWVMGEQGAKNLRGTSMEDVIFAGTSDRPPLGRAQVTLTIDNTDRALDIDYTEVTISRTIFRNGGSEYAINGAACRLLDIQELLSDTGLGQQMHVIVGQGRLDAILRADPSGHRAFIEEAAGILKHRKRKERALRKLANTEANLSRLDDLLGEIHRQLGPLGRQARISRRAEGIQVTLRDAQARLFAEDALQLRTRRELNDTRLEEARIRREQGQRELIEVKGRIARLEMLGTRSNPALAALDQTWHDLSQIAERLRSVASLAEERSRSTEGQIVTNLGEDPALLLHRADELHVQAVQQQETVAAARLTFDQATEARAGEEQRLASARQTLAELRKSEQQRDARIASYRELIAREESAIELADTRVKDFSAQRTGLLEQREHSQRQYDDLDRERQTSLDDDGEALRQAQEILRQSQDVLRDNVEALHSLQGKIIALRSKADALDDTLQGRSASVSFHGDDSVAVLGGIAQYVHIADGWQEAVSRALGEFANALVVPDVESMLEALSHVETEHLGKLAMLRPRDTDETAAIGRARNGETEDDVVAVSTLVDVNSHARDQAMARRIVAAVRELLADCAAADDRKTALRAVGNRRWRCSVTRDGAVFHRVGVYAGSSLSQSDLSLAARRDAALEQMRRLDVESKSLEATVERLQGERDKARLDVDAQTRANTERQVKARQVEQSMASASSRVERLGHQIAALDEKITTMRTDAKNHGATLDDLRHALDGMRQSEETHGDLDELERREREGERRLTEAREREMASKLTWKEANTRLSSLERQQGLLRDQADQAQTRRARMLELNERRRSRIVRLRRIESDATRIVRLIRQSIEEVAQRREVLRQQTSSHDKELASLRTRREQLEKTVEQQQHDEHALDVDRERQTAAFGQLTQKVSDTLGMDVDELIKGYGPTLAVPLLDENGQMIPVQGDESGGDADSVDVPVAAPDERRTGDTQDGRVSLSQHYRTVPYRREEQMKRLEKAQRDLKALGKVNPLATEEFDALQTRNRYLHEQRDDVASSRADLMQLVADLDATMTAAFSSAFDDTARAFEQVFATLFPGGTGKLRLENPEDMLTTGVIVEASPAGKRVKQLSLLSGGERSLTALALLFAIFTARPSPFYVMDEVEAALDSVNLTRLLNALEDLRQHAQLIIITHQQRTMAIADALYGITMRADGVTAVMSQKLDPSTRPHTGK